MRELGWGRRGERLSMKKEGKCCGSELGSDLDLGPDPDPDPWKILWIQIWQNDADPLDPDPQLNPSLGRSLYCCMQHFK